MNDAELVRELKAIGPLCGVTDGEVTSWHGPVDNDLAQMVVAAHDKPASDPAVLALRDHLGTGSELWKSYVKVRNRSQRLTRRDLYRSITDPLLLEALEEATAIPDGAGYTIRVPAEAWDGWKSEKERIRSENPYPINEEG